MYDNDNRKTIHRQIVIYEDQLEWLDKNAINLSKWVRNKLDDGIEGDNDGT